MPTGGGLRRRSFHRDYNGTTAIEPTKYLLLAINMPYGMCGSAYCKAIFLQICKLSSSAAKPQIIQSLATPRQGTAVCRGKQKDFWRT